MEAQVCHLVRPSPRNMLGERTRHRCTLRIHLLPLSKHYTPSRSSMLYLFSAGSRFALAIHGPFTLPTIMSSSIGRAPLPRSLRFNIEEQEFLLSVTSCVESRTSILSRVMSLAPTSYITLSTYAFRFAATFYISTLCYLATNHILLLC